MFDDTTMSDVESWSALGSGAAIAIYGMTRRSVPGLCLALAATPLVYRGLTGNWPALARPDYSEDTRVALGGERGIHVFESVRVDRPIEEVFRFWRRLENLPRFMTHLESVVDRGNGYSRWIAQGPAGSRVAWNAQIINEVENQVIGWRSLPASDVVTAGSVNFDSVPEGDGTQVTVKLQYAPPAGRAGDFVAALFGRSPAQTIREDMGRFKQMLEADSAPSEG